MPFPQIDRIVELDVAQGRICAHKALSLAEGYLADHFPRFPVMPGVLMLEALYQTAYYLVVLRDAFARPKVELAEARNIKFADFVTPGDLLATEIEWVKELDERDVLVKGRGTVGQQTVVSGRLVLRRSPAESEADRVRRVRHLRSRLARLGNGNERWADVSS